MFRKDSLRLGIICGVLAPVIAFWLYYFVTYRNFNQIAFLQKITSMGLSSAVLSLSLLSNLALFFLFLDRKKDMTARGVLMATILYAIIGFILKFAA